MKWLIRWQQECWWKLLSEKEQKQYIIEFVTAALLRGDTKTRYEAHASAIVNGWKSRNEVRGEENMNTADGLDEFLTPMNMDGAHKHEPNGDADDE